MLLHYLNERFGPWYLSHLVIIKKQSNYLIWYRLILWTIFATKNSYSSLNVNRYFMTDISNCWKISRLFHSNAEITSVKTYTEISSYNLQLDRE